MRATKVIDTESFQNVHAVKAKKEIYNTNSAQVIHMLLKSGQSLKKDTTPVDVFFYILEGKA